MNFYAQEAAMAGQCDDVPCLITSFTVAVTDQGADVFRFTVSDDNCGLITNAKFLSGILRKALAAAIAADDLTEPACGCCRDGAGLSLNLEGKYGEITLAGLSVDDYVVEPPFYSGS